NRIRFIVHHHLGTIRREPALCRLVFQELRPDPLYRQTRLFKLNQAYTHRIIEVVRGAGGRGGSRPKVSRPWGRAWSWAGWHMARGRSGARGAISIGPRRPTASPMSSMAALSRENLKTSRWRKRSRAWKMPPRGSSGWRDRKGIKAQSDRLDGRRHCEERSDDAIQKPRKPGLLRFARNDELYSG